jgi:hypothetical protein
MLSMMRKETSFSIDTSGLTGSLLEDKLLQDALLYSANNDTVYSSSYGDWIPQSLFQ